MSAEDDDLRAALSDASRDDGQEWGFLLDNGLFVRLPKVPLLLGGYGPPPFDVILPSGETRHVVHRQAREQADTTAPPAHPATGGSTSGAG